MNAGSSVAPVSTGAVALHFDSLKAAGFKYGGWLAVVTEWPEQKAPPVLAFSQDWDVKTCIARVVVRPGQVLFGGCGSRGVDSKVPPKLKFRHFYIVQRSHHRRELVARVLPPAADARGLFMRSKLVEMQGTTYPVPTVLDGSRETMKHLAQAVTEELDFLGFEGVRLDSEAPGVTAKTLLARVHAALEIWPEFEQRLAHFRFMLVAVVEARDQAKKQRNAKNAQRALGLSAAPAAAGLGAA